MKNDIKKMKRILFIMFFLKEKRSTDKGIKPKISAKGINLSG